MRKDAICKNSGDQVVQKGRSGDGCIPFSTNGEIAAPKDEQFE
jgi:hypothetical protein